MPSIHRILSEYYTHFRCSDRRMKQARFHVQHTACLVQQCMIIFCIANGAKGLEDRHPAALLLSRVGQEKCLQQVFARCLLRDEGLYNDSDMTARWLRESRVEFCCESKQVPKDLMDGHPTHM